MATKTSTVTIHGKSGSGYPENPVISAKVTYDTKAKRSGNKISLDVSAKINGLGGYSYFGYSIDVYADLDGGTKKKLFSKGNTPSQWSTGDYKGSATVTSTNTSTTCKLHISVVCNCGCSKSGSKVVMKTFTLSAPASDYTVKYNANGGTGAPSSQTKVAGKTLTLSSTKPTRSYTISFNGNGGSSPSSIKANYKFVGWNTKADGSGTTYQAGGSYTKDASVTLYAMWEREAFTLPTPASNNIKVTYNAMGGSVSPTSKSIPCTFLGWYTQASGGTKVTNSTNITSNTTLYAHWSSTTIGSLPTPTWSGNLASFIKWYYEDSYEKEVKSTDSISKGVTIYAKWKYAIDFYGNGGYFDDGSGTMKTYTRIWKEYNKPITIPHYIAVYPEDDDGSSSREFSGWKSTTGTWYAIDSLYRDNKPLVLYAQYRVNTYKVRWLKGYGKDQVIQEMTVAHGTTLNSAPKPSGQFPANPTRKGYSFSGWRGNWDNITDDEDIVAMWGFSPIWIYTNSGWVAYQPTDPDDKDED